MEKKPDGLYVPYNPLKLDIGHFNGPLDLLLYLIKKQNLDILDIPMTMVAKQYDLYISSMDILNYELAGDYLLMSALLADIKAKMLLPRYSGGTEGEDDPRVDLAARLMEYQRFKEAAETLDAIPRIERDIILPQVELQSKQAVLRHPDIVLQDVLDAWIRVLNRMELKKKYMISEDAVNLRDCITMAITKLKLRNKISYTELIDPRLGKIGLALTFYALLFLYQKNVIALLQDESLGQIDISLLIPNWSLEVTSQEYDEVRQ